MWCGIASSEDVTPEQREWARQFIAKQEFAGLRHCPSPPPKMEPSIVSQELQFHEVFHGSPIGHVTER